MTVKKRLAISNIIMIIIPVVITLMVGLSCVGVIYYTLQNSNGFGFENYDEFYNMSRTVSDRMYEVFEHGSKSSKERLEFIGNIIDKDTTYVEVYENGSEFYTVGNNSLKDSRLMESAKAVGTNSFVSNIDHQLFYYTESSKGNIYELYFTANNYHTDNNKAKGALIISAVLVVSAIILSILFTNRFLTRFIFKKIEEPLDILSNGVNEIASGNLDYRLSYSRNDEFLPVCLAFNDMAGRLKKSTELAQRNEENRKELLLDISHDLRSPLTSIQAYVEGLIDGVASSPQMRDKYLHTIKRKTADIEKMVSSLFAYSKLDMEEFSINEESIEMPDYIEQYLSEIKDEYLNSGLELKIITGDSLKVKADRELLNRIISNILDNSLKYKTSDTGKCEISVSKENDLAKIEFSDNGPGVDEGNLDKLFDVFYRTDKARSDTGNGSGIGLAFVKKAAEEMGGGVKAEKSKLGGLSIIIYLRCENE